MIILKRAQALALLWHSKWQHCCLDTQHFLWMGESLCLTGIFHPLKLLRKAEFKCPVDKRTDDTPMDLPNFNENIFLRRKVMVSPLIRVIIVCYCTDLVFSVFLFVVTASRKVELWQDLTLAPTQKIIFSAYGPFLFPSSGHHQLVMGMEGKDHVYFISTSLEKRVFLVNSSNALCCQWVFGSKGIQSLAQAILLLRDIEQVLEKNNTGPIWSVFEKKYRSLPFCSGPLSMMLLQLTSGFH